MHKDVGATSSTDQVDGGLADGLARWFARRRGLADARVDTLTRPSAGYSSETLFVDVSWSEDGGRRRAAHVVRMAPPSVGTFADYDLVSQWQAQMAASAVGVPVADPEVEADDDWVGAPFIVMPRIDGHIVGAMAHRDPWLRALDRAQRRRVYDGFLTTVAAIHRADPASAPGVPRRDNAAELDFWQGYLSWSCHGRPVPALVGALEWCREHRPDDEPSPALLWGDVRFENTVLDDDGRVRAVLDWDMTSVGAPEHDLAWFTSLDLTMHRLFGKRADGFPDRDATVARLRGAERPSSGGPRLVRDLGHGPEHGHHDPHQRAASRRRAAPHAAHRGQPHPRPAGREADVSDPTDGSTGAPPAGPADTAAELVRLRAGDDSTGVLFEGRAWTWRQVVAEAELRAELLLSLRQDGPFHVGVLLENTPEYLFLLAGAALAGAVVVGVNPTRRGAELATDIRRADCQLLVTDSTQVGLVDQLDLGLAPDRLLVVDDDEYTHRLDGLRPTGDEARPALPEPTSDQLFLLIFTSGSTGGPKAVRMTQGRAARAASRVGFSPEDVLYSAMPLFHGNALSAAVLPALASGATLALRRRFSASSFLPDVRACGATFFNSVGRAIAHIVATPPTEHDRHHHLRYVLGPETSARDKAAFTDRFGVPLIEGYGSSENAIVLKPVPDPKPGALGRASSRDDVAVVDPDTGEELPPAELDGHGRLVNAEACIGELVGRKALSNFEGYYNNPEADAERTRNGWYWSGDLAYRDPEGIFYFAGRTGDWLRVDSENFAAAPVERILARFEGVSGVAVYPVPDPSTGDQVMAALELEHGVAFDPDAFTAFLAAQEDLGTKWAPRFVRLVSALPVTATDKTDKKPLRAEQWRTGDPIWHRQGRSDRYVRLTPADVDRMVGEFAANGRSSLIGR